MGRDFRLQHPDILVYRHDVFMGCHPSCSRCAKPRQSFDAELRGFVNLFLYCVLSTGECEDHSCGWSENNGYGRCGTSGGGGGIEWVEHEEFRRAVC